MKKVVIDGINYELNQEEKTASVLALENGKYEGNIVIPSHICDEGVMYVVTLIGTHAFYECNLLKSICLPDSIQEIGICAFESCELLSCVILSNIRLIHPDAFRNCVSLSSIIFPDTLCTIKRGAFAGCKSLLNIRIPQGVTEIEPGAFANCSSLYSIIVEKNNTVYNSNDNCNAIIETESNKLICGCNSTIIPNNCTAISDRAFLGCSLIQTINVPASVKAIGVAAFENCSLLNSFKIPHGVNVISVHLFKGCVSLSSIEIPCSVQKIQISAFSGCRSLTHLNIPESVEFIDMMAFEGCSSLQSIIIPENVKCIETKICKGCTNLKQVSFSNSINIFSACAFNNCSCLENIDVPSDAFICYCEEVQNNLLPIIGERDKCINKCLIQVDHEANGEYIVEEGIMHIGRRAFAGCNKITKLVLPSSIKSIGREAFMDCSELQSLSIPEGVSILPTGVFRNCTNLISVYLPNTLQEMKASIFEGCESLEEIILPEGLTNISERCFKDCKNLKRIIIPSSVKIIEELAISGCEQLIDLIIPEGVNQLKDYAIYGCSNLETISLPSTLKLFDKKPVGYLPKFKHFNVPVGTMPYFKKTIFRKYVVESTDENKNKKYLSNELKYAAMYYRQLGMNITQIKRNSLQSSPSEFKNPFDSEWRNYIENPQTLDYIMSMDWEEMGGIGVVLGYNNYRAIDVDHVFKGLIDQYFDGNLDSYINTFLNTLGLPDDYPWVVYSGSGDGFHIIFKSNDVDLDMDTVSFESSPYGEFKTLDLLWNFHLVLPPSIHAKGQYKFRNDQYPTIPPTKIELGKIEELLENNCSSLAFYTFNLNDNVTSLELVKREKTYTNNYTTCCLEDTQIWLESANTNESKNSLALMYLTGNKEVICDHQKSLDLLKEAGTQTSIFNLLSLYAAGVFNCSYQEFWDLFSKLDKTYFWEHIELIKQNAEKNIKKPKEYLFFDTECNGLPDDYKLGVSFTNNWPRMIQLAWIVTDENGNMLKRQSHIIYPQDFTIDSEVEKLTGISTLRAQQEGVELNEVLSEFMNDLANADEIIGHNVDFDFHIVGCELYRTGGAYDELMNRQYICTMQASTDFCAIPSNSPYGGYKWPKLEELYRKLFGRMFDNAHDALADVVATKECFFALKQRGLVK